MFRISTNEDISDEEYEKYVLPFFNELKYFLDEYIFPEICAYAIAIGYNKDYLYYESFDIQLSHGLDLFNVEPTNKSNVKMKVRKILKDKYFLNIISEDPLDFEVQSND